MSRIAWVLELRGWFIFLGACLLLPSVLQAQQPNCKPWITVQKWQGTVTVTGRGTSTDSIGDTSSLQESDTIQLTFSGSTGNCPAQAEWGATGQSINMQVSVVTSSADVLGCQQDRQKTNAHPVYPADAMVAGIHMDFIKGIYFMHMARSFPSVPWDVETNSDACGQVSPSVLDVFGPDPFCVDPLGESLIPLTALPSSLGSLSGSFVFSCAPISPGPFFWVGGTPYTWTIRWNFSPTPPNLDLLVTIPQYQTWRPAGGTTEKDIGFDPATGSGELEIDAQLWDKDTNAASTIIPDKITFSLVKVSTEPGVAMNWPAAGSATIDPDMTFDAVSNIIATVSPNGLKADIVPTDTPPTMAFVASHDWGGWATLNVTATVAGQPINGHLQGDPTKDILLPKRQAGSNIADSWKTDPKHNIPLSTPDSDDSEPDPAGRSDCVGDGFTLYEEYRGFMENGKHIEGDPNSKDFFIVNEVGADAEPGIFLFTSLTGLTVHKDIQINEVETRTTNSTVGGVSQEGTPIINFNADATQGAFEVQQHGVLIRTCSVLNGKAFDGGLTIWPGGTHAQPAITDFICMQGRDVPGTILNPSNTHNGVITAVNALLQYDGAVSHELLHSVGVLHHGDYQGVEGIRPFSLLGPNDPLNTTGRPLFQLSGQNVQILDEVSGLDLAPIAFQNTQARLQQCPAIEQNPSAYPSSLLTWCIINSRNLSFPEFWVGFPHGKHSGDDRCVMRYPFAEVYPQASNEGDTVSNTIFYHVPAGTEPLGFSLCTSPAGNKGGINDPARTIPKSHPQPRYWDARAGRGACKLWVCVSDNYPLRLDQAAPQ
jgi:hypothetical protein